MYISEGASKGFGACRLCSRLQARALHMEMGFRGALGWKRCSGGLQASPPSRHPLTCLDLEHNKNLRCLEAWLLETVQVSPEAECLWCVCRRSWW